MAKKGQKFKKIDPQIKLEILKKYFDGAASTMLLEKEYGISHKTIQTWIYKTNNNIDVTIDHRNGHSGRIRSKNLSIEDFKERYEILKKYQAFLEARHEKK